MERKGSRKENGKEMTLYIESENRQLKFGGHKNEERGLGESDTHCVQTREVEVKRTELCKWKTANGMGNLEKKT